MYTDRHKKRLIMISLLNDLEIILICAYFSLLYLNWDIFNDRECYGHHGN
jgi:hypothetical protein